MKIIIILLSLLVSFAIEAQNCFISEGKEWTVDGMMYGSDDTCIRFTNKHKISQVENVDGKIIAILQAKSWRAATEFEPSEWSGNVVITECDDKLYIGERLVFDFLCKLCSCLFNNEDGFSDIVRKAKQIIDTEYSDLSGVFDISERLGVSQNHLCRVFSYETKTTPIEYLTRVRLKEAVNLLNDGNDTVEEIAIKCGFSCGNYFCKVFKKNMGISPLEYRGKTKLTNYDSIVI